MLDIAEFNKVLEDWHSYKIAVYPKGSRLSNILLRIQIDAIDKEVVVMRARIMSGEEGKDIEEDMLDLEEAILQLKMVMLMRTLKE